MNVHAVEQVPAWSAATEAQDILADYGSLGFTLGGIRWPCWRRFASRGISSAAEDLNRSQHGRKLRTRGWSPAASARYRQRVVFVTLEDESGCVNVVVWSDLFERYRRELLGRACWAWRAGSKQRWCSALIAGASSITRRCSPPAGRSRRPSHDFH
jgi:error-prone DNA polymerase